MPGKSNFQKLAERGTEEADNSANFGARGCRDMSAHLCTYVLWDLDEGEGVLRGLCWQGPGAEGGRHGSQTGARHNFSLRKDTGRTFETRHTAAFMHVMLTTSCDIKTPQYFLS